jgi:hypothetical protein
MLQAIIIKVGSHTDSRPSRRGEEFDTQMSTHTPRRYLVGVLARTINPNCLQLSSDNLWRFFSWVVVKA